MNPQELIRRTAIHQDTINGLNDPTPWPVKWWAEAGDTVWTAGTATSTGEDSAGMYYEPGDIIVHRNVIDGDHTQVTGAFNIYPEPGMDPMKEMLQGIRQWDGTEPERWGEVVRPGDATLDVPGTGRTLPMGWSAGLAMAASSAGGLDPALLQASLMQAALEHEPRPLVFFQEDNGYDLMVFSWYRNEQGLYDARSFKHLQYDDLGMQVTTISHSETPDTFPARAMSDGELLTQSRMAFDDYQRLREHDAGPDGHGITGHVARSGILKPGLEQHPLLHLADGRQAPEWDGFIDAAAIGILEGKPLTQPPVRRESRAGQEHPADAAPATRRNPLTHDRWNSPRKRWRNPGRRSNACRNGSPNTCEPAPTSHGPPSNGRAGSSTARPRNPTTGSGPTVNAARRQDCSSTKSPWRRAKRKAPARNTP
ncbi:hypothetical protein AB4920_09710 [Bifidobacterium dentium]|uniref:hypothetical protein n=1 Tax=Bifidobacterium dentium TaxID=1689 RepID=UPI003D17FFA4